MKLIPKSLIKLTPYCANSSSNIGRMRVAASTQIISICSGFTPAKAAYFGRSSTIAPANSIPVKPAPHTKSLRRFSSFVSRYNFIVLTM
ncbi:hypothetical protein SAM_1707 [Streptococcus agalactiae CJB111]|nr:hypothetical protein SAM_1707 [Streptococcus agalactiae CJB111]